MQAVAPLVLVDKYNECIRRLNGLHMKMVAKNIQITYEHHEIHELMAEAHIPYTIIKGCASAEYYPYPNLRVMGDIDFLVPKDYSDTVCQLLQINGFTQNKNIHAYHIGLEKNGYSYEMHTDMPGMPEGEYGDIIHHYLDDIFTAGKKLNNPEMIVPCEFHHGLILLLHMSQHLLSEGIGLRHLCDWAVFVSKCNDFELLFKEKLQNCGLWHFAQVITTVCTEYLGLDEQRWVDKAVLSNKALAEQMIMDVIASGNMGRKDPARSNQGYLISTWGKNGVPEHSVLKQTILTMNNVVMTKWPVSKSCHILFPIGWVVFGARHVFQMMIGTRSKMKVDSMISGAQHRKQIYRQLKLFERKNTI